MIINLNNNKNNNEPEQNIDELQKETLETMKEYIGNLAPKLTEMVDELRGELAEDTWEYLRMMLDGFNWVIEAYNATSSVINKDNTVINNAEIDGAVKILGDEYAARNPIAVADVIEAKIIPFLNTLSDAI